MRAITQRTPCAANLARLSWQPPVASFDRTGWSQRHRQAITAPAHEFERAYVWMLAGWLLYADAHRNAYESTICDDGVLGKEWAAIGDGLRGLLNGDLKRLDGGTLDSILNDTLEANGINPEDV